ncbi:MAG: sulfite reductase subunit alpha, partial [Haemophilus parainfluenzae]|nr:sulfite reductase subunit alpha [Haemophilus parainfluenzae]
MQHNNPLPTEILNLLPTLTPLQLAWLSGYAWSQASGVEQQAAGQHLTTNLTALSAEPFSITVLSGSQTGNAKSVADKVAAELT